MKVYYINNFYNFNYDTVLPANTLIVKHDYIKELQTKNKVIDWSEYKSKYLELESYNNLALIGISKMINPANRCQFINDYLSVMTRNKNKFIFDNKPFEGEPWRLFWNYQFANLDDEIFKINYSYPIEDNYLKWFYREKNQSLFIPHVLGSSLKNYFYTELKAINFKVSFYDVTEEDLKNYEELKLLIKEKYYTPKLIINNLLKLCNNLFNVNINFNSYLEQDYLVLPDLKIYHFMAEENTRRKNIYNIFIKD
jgi:hypothetical protein